MKAIRPNIHIDLKTSEQVYRTGFCSPPAQNKLSSGKTIDKTPSCIEWKIDTEISKKSRGIQSTGQILLWFQYPLIRPQLRWLSALRRHMPGLSSQWSCRNNIYLVSIKTQFGNTVGPAGLPLPHTMKTSTRGKMRQQYFLCKHLMQSRWTSRKLWRTWGALRVWLFHWSKACRRNKINMKRTAVKIAKKP